MEEFRDMNTAGPYYQRVWDRLCQAPDGDIRGFPHFARIAVGESSLFCHRDLVFLEYEHAKNALKNACIKKNWTQLRLVYIGMSDPESLFAQLPLELIHNIATRVAPYAFPSSKPAPLYNE